MISLLCVYIVALGALSWKDLFSSAVILSTPHPIDALLVQHFSDIA